MTKAKIREYLLEMRLDLLDIVYELKGEPVITVKIQHSIDMLKTAIFNIELALGELQ